MGTSQNLTRWKHPYLLLSNFPHYIHTTSGEVMLPLLPVRKIITYILNLIYQIFNGSIPEPDSLEAPLPPPPYFSSLYSDTLRNIYLPSASYSRNYYIYPPSALKSSQ